MDASGDATMRASASAASSWCRASAPARTQRAQAAHLGISSGEAIRKWEAGEGYPSSARLQALMA